MSSYTRDGDQNGVQSWFMNWPYPKFVLFGICRCHGIGPYSTVNQHSLLLLVDYGVSHIQWP